MICLFCKALGKAFVSTQLSPATFLLWLVKKDFSLCLFVLFLVGLLSSCLLSSTA